MARHKPVAPNKPEYDSLILPNAGSPHATPASLRCDLHFAHLKAYERWDWARFQRLAVFLNLTVYELGSIACITHHQVELFEKTNRLKLGGARDRSGTLVLTLIEYHMCKAYSTDVIEDPFPKINDFR